MYYKNADGAVIVFDLTNYQSFTRTKMWVKQVSDENTKCKFILVGNKLDIEQKREVTKQMADKLASEYNSIYVEVAAKTGENLENFMENFIKNNF